MKAFKVCYVSSEVSPFANAADTGELADTSNALPVALKEMDQDIRLMMPKYKSINERKFVLREVIRLKEVKIELVGEEKIANGKTAFLPNSKVHVYFLSVPEYFDKKGFYKDPQTGKEYPDNAPRFACFCKAVLETLKLLYWPPDIIHCNDWATALIPFYLKNQYKDDEFFQNTRTLLTVHNFSNQGIYPAKMAPKIGVPDEYVAPGKEFELNGKLNLLKGGLSFADMVNTVSENFAREIVSDPEATFGLHEVILARKKDVSGILNGADYATWDPETDQNISTNYDSKTLAKKDNNKKELCKELDLKYDPSAAVIAMITELSEENGAELVLEGFNNLLKMKIKLVVMGKGDSKYDKEFRKLVKEHPEKFVFHERFDNRLAHLLLAGADMMLIPPKKVTEGAYHLESLKYGTIPIVREIGALADCVKNFDPETGKGNGFSFADFKKTAMLKTIQDALRIFNDKKSWAKLQKNAMRGDFSWGASARKYLKLYEKVAKKK